MTLILMVISASTALAQNDSLNLYPKVQDLSQNGDSFEFNGFTLKKAEKWEDLVERTPVGDLIADPDKQGLELKIKLKKKTKADQMEGNKAKAEGAYDLSVDKNKVSLKAKDSTGVFYGLQTLTQLVKDKKISPVEIHDFPTVKYRGVVEGFYGVPWSQEDRIRQIKFYGQNKANTYIYGPKDDPYHSSPDWRKPYPEDQAADIKKLVKIADKNFVDFVWAIHPGKDIKWNEEDRQNVLDKFEHMYDLGVRSFALFFDDITGEGTDAQKQADLLNFLNDKFVEAKDAVNPLILTPTDYNKSWADPSDDGYLSILGRELDPSIQIMWTGDCVVCDVTESTLDWVNNLIDRPALFWWNYPVSDYVRDQLILGPSYGLDQDVDADAMAGVLSNPMEHAEASKPAIFGVADYGWNTSSYDSETAWEAGIKQLMPHSYKPYMLFAENNSDPSSDLESQHGKESKTIAPYLNRLENRIPEDSADQKDLVIAKDFFKDVRQAADKIKEANDNSRLIKEIKPWLGDFTQLGQKGLNQLNTYKFREESPEKYWETMLSNQQDLGDDKANAFTAEDNTKINPTTGTALLRPFIKFLKNWNNEHLIAKITGESDFKTENPGLGAIDTDIEALKDKNLRAGPDQAIQIPPVLEVFQIEPKASFQIELSEPMSHAEVNALFESGETQWMTIETSEDGENWTKPEQNEKDNHVKANINKTFKFLRTANASNDTVNLRLNTFVIKDKTEKDGNQPLFTHDLNVFTGFDLKSGQPMIEKSKMDAPEQAVILTDSEDTELQLEAKTSKGQWESLSNPYHGDYIKVDLPKNAKSLKISSDQDIQVYEVLWK